MSSPETIVLPGFVDLHDHFREPSTNRSETIGNGSRAALLGGFALVCDMPNNPGLPTWSRLRIDQKIAIARSDAYNLVRFHAGAQPEADNLDELEAMAEVAVGLKLYGSPNVSNYQEYETEDFRPAAETWHKVSERPILFHRGDSSLEEMITLVAEQTGHHLHVCHTNHPGEVQMVQAAKKSGLPVSIGICPHHVFKTSHSTMTEGWRARCLPPLADQDKAQELYKMLASGEIDVVETDYAPHSKEAKLKAERANPIGHGHPASTCYGLPGIEHVVPLFLHQMINKKTISRARLIDAMHTRPQQILGIKLPPTEFTWDTELHVVGEDYEVHSGTDWSPYLGSYAVGKLVHAVIDGHEVVKNGVPQKVPELATVEL